MKRSLKDKFFKDKDGKVVLTQAPNKPLWAFVIFFAANTLTMPYHNHWLSAVLSIGSFISLGIWACLELTRGVNYFRRVLGAVVLVMDCMMAMGIYWLLTHL